MSLVMPFVWHVPCSEDWMYLEDFPVFFKGDIIMISCLNVLHSCLLLKRVYPKRKEFAPCGSKFFSFRVDSFSERRQKQFSQSYLLWKYMYIHPSNGFIFLFIYFFFSVFRDAAGEARLNSELELQKTGHRPTIRPYTCGQCLCCGDSCGCKEVIKYLITHTYTHTHTHSSRKYFFVLFLHENICCRYSLEVPH